MKALGANDWTPISAFGSMSSSIDVRTCDIDDLKATIARESVVALRHQSLGANELHRALSRLGVLREVPFLRSLPGTPGVARVRREPGDGRLNLGAGWHSDLSYMEDTPRYSAVYMEEPPARGGETSFASLKLARRRVSSPLEALLRQLTCRYTASVMFGPDGFYASSDDAPEIVVTSAAAQHHSVVRPLLEACGTDEVLMFDPGYCEEILGLTYREAVHVWALLTELVTADDCTLRWSWSAGDLLVWDNRSILHRVLSNFDDRRSMLRANVWAS